MMNLLTLWKTIQTNKAIVLTPNRRLALHLQRSYQDYQRQNGNTLWETPTILPLDTWLTQCWQELTDIGIELPLLLNSSQEFVLWERIIKSSSHTSILLQIEPTTHLVKNAWQSLKQWQIQCDQKTFSITEETQAFYTWAKEYENYSTQHCFSNLVGLTDIIGLHLYNLIAKKILIFACFDQMTPQWQQLICRINSYCEIHYFNPEVKTMDAKQTKFSNLENEIIQMVCWTKNLYEKNPEKKIACIIPNLATTRRSIESAFQSQFGENPPINFSIGFPLANYPIIYTALLSLKLFNRELSLNEWSYLLRSPFLVSAENERLNRYQLASELTELNNEILSITTISHLAEKKGLTLSKQLAEVSFLENTTHSLDEWTTKFTELLAKLAWSGNLSFNKIEWQILERWKKLLNEFKNLQLVLPNCDFQEAYRQLLYLANNTLFQAATEEKPIQILGLLEAAGLQFDHLWIMGMDANTWPPAANPNPFIPLHLQRQSQLPHSSAERELDFCRQLTTRFMQSANEVIFSYSEWQDDYECLPSPLIQHLPKADEINFSAGLQNLETLHSPIMLEKLLDDYGTPIKQADSLRGGSFILKQQAACPFRAFTEFRLGAKRLATPHFGLDAIDRGIVLHRALDFLWHTLRDHQTLLNKTSDELNILISDNINKALKPFFANQSLNKFLSIEKKRLQNLLQRWLELEKNRKPFRVIAQEAWQSVKLAGATLQLRIDRMDQLFDGSKIIIDYKTGLTRISDWLDDRLDEPQLPLYSLSDPEITALVYAQIRSDKMVFKGLSKSDSGISGVAPLENYNDDRITENWEVQIEKWRENLTSLMKNFLQGYAKIDPKNSALTCQYCDFASLCRVRE